MRRFKYILYSLMAICLFSITACESEKDLIILSGELPSKVKALYLVGNAAHHVFYVEETLVAAQVAEAFVYTVILHVHDALSQN